MLEEINIHNWKTDNRLEGAELLLFSKTLGKVVFIDYSELTLYVTNVDNQSAFTSYSVSQVDFDTIRTGPDLVYCARAHKTAETVIFDVETESFSIVKVPRTEVLRIIKSPEGPDSYLVFTARNKVIKVEYGDKTAEQSLSITPKNVVGTSSGCYVFSENELVSLDLELKEVGWFNLASVKQSIVDKDKLYVVVNEGREIELKCVLEGSIETMLSFDGLEYGSYEVYDKIVSFTNIVNGRSSPCVLLYSQHSDGYDSTVRALVLDISSREKISLTVNAHIARSIGLKLDSVVKLNASHTILSGYQVIDAHAYQEHSQLINQEVLESADPYLIYTDSYVSDFINLRAPLDSSLFKRLLDTLLEPSEMHYYMDKAHRISDPGKAIKEFWIPVSLHLIGQGRWMCIKRIIDYKDSEDYVLKDLECFFDKVVRPVHEEIVNKSREKDFSYINESLEKLKGIVLLIECVYLRKLREANANKEEQKINVYLDADEKALNKYKQLADTAKAHVDILKLGRFVKETALGFSYFKSKMSQNPMHNLQDDRYTILNQLVKEQQIQLDKERLLAELASTDDFDRALDLVLYVIILETGPYTGDQPFDEYYQLIVSLPFYNELSALVEMSPMRLSNVMAYTMLDHLSPSDRSDTIDFIVKKAVYLLEAELAPQSIRFAVLKKLAALQRHQELIMLLNDRTFITERDYMEQVLVLLIDLDMAKTAYDLLVEYNARFASKISFTDFIERAKGSENFHHLLSLNLEQTERLFLEQLLNRPENAALNFFALLKQGRYEEALRCYNGNRERISGSYDQFLAYLLSSHVNKGSEDLDALRSRFFKDNRDAKLITEEENISIHEQSEPKPGRNTGLGNNPFAGNSKQKNANPFLK